MIRDLNFPGLYSFSKDLQSRYLHFSESLLEWAELTSKQDVGKTDLDFSWKVYAEYNFLIDQKISQEGLPYCNKVHSISLKNRNAEILVSKYPLLDRDGNCIGVSGHFVEITGHCLIPKKGYRDHTSNRFYFNDKPHGKYLTGRETDVLKLLMIGHPPKKIALLLNISKRTVEEYIDNIKTKLNCSITAEIVPAAFMMGLNHLIL